MIVPKGLETAAQVAKHGVGDVACRVENVIKVALNGLFCCGVVGRDVLLGDIEGKDIGQESDHAFLQLHSDLLHHQNREDLLE